MSGFLHFGASRAVACYNRGQGRTIADVQFAENATQMVADRFDKLGLFSIIAPQLVVSQIHDYQNTEYMFPKTDLKSGASYLHHLKMSFGFPSMFVAGSLACIVAVFFIWLMKSEKTATMRH